LDLIIQRRRTSEDGRGLVHQFGYYDRLKGELFMSRTPPRSIAPPVQDDPAAPTGHWPPRQRSQRAAGRLSPALVAVIGAGALILIGIVITIAIVSVNAINRRQANKAALQSLERQAHELRAAALEQLDSDGMVSAGQYSSFVDSVEKTASQATGQQALVLQAGVKTLRSMQDQLARYDDAFQRFSEKGGIDPGTMKSKKSVEERLALVRQMKVESDALSAIVEQFPARFEDELDQAKVDASIKARELAAFQRSANLELMKKVRDEDRILCASIKGALEILHQEWGSWRLEGDAVNFENDAALAKYKKFIEDLQSAAVRQERYQRQMLSGNRSAAP
jgi:hypothetical protein